jgi:hypothetical protein
MKTRNPNDSVGIVVTDDAIRFAEYMLPSWRVVLLVFAGMFLSMPLYWSNIVTMSQRPRLRSNELKANE